MAKNINIFFTKDVRFKGTQFVQADGTAAKQVFNPSVEGSRLEGIIITTTAASAKVAFLQLNDGVNIVKLGHISVPANAGQGSVSAVSGLNRGNLPWLAIDAFGNPFINLNTGMNIEIKLQSALNVGETLDVTCFGANYDA